MDTLNALFRWLHILAGIIWIGMLYFFNWVNGPFAGDHGRRHEEEGVPGADAARPVLVPLGRRLDRGSPACCC